MKIFALVAFLASLAHADDLTIHVPPAPPLFNCRLLVLASDLANEGSAEWEFPATVGGSHGGDALEFKSGTHEITVIADKQWMGVTWLHSGKKVAEAMFVIGSEDRAEYRVGIIKDPQNEGDQISINCDAYHKP